MSLDISLVVFVDTGAIDGPVECEIYTCNYTHNVVPMWKVASVYNALYESHGKQAGEIVSELQQGLNFMRANYAKMEELNPSNGWGSADSAISMLERFVQACIEHPKCQISVCK